MEVAAGLPAKPPTSTITTKYSPTKPAPAASNRTKKPQKTDAQHLSDLHRIYDVRIGNRLRAERLGEEPFLIDNRDDYRFQPDPPPYSLSTRDMPFSYEERYIQYMRLRYDNFEQDGLHLRLHPISQGTRRYAPPLERPIEETHQAKKRKLSSVELEDPNRPKKKMSLSEYKARSAAGSRAGTPARGSVSGGEDLRKEVLKNVAVLKKDEMISQSQQDARGLPVTPTITIEDADQPAFVKEETNPTEVGTVGGVAEATTLPFSTPTTRIEAADQPPEASKKSSHEQTDARDQEQSGDLPALKKQKVTQLATKHAPADSADAGAIAPPNQQPSNAIMSKAGTASSAKPSDPPSTQVEKEQTKQQETSTTQPKKVTGEGKLSNEAPLTEPEQSLASPVSQTSKTSHPSTADMLPPLASLPDCEWDVTPPWLTPPGYDSRVAPTTPSSPDTIGPRGGSDSGTSRSSQKSETFDAWSSDSDRTKKVASTAKPSSTPAKQKPGPKPASTADPDPKKGAETAGKAKAAPRPKNSGWFASFAASPRPPSRPSTAGK